jgi:hypothetical protein
MLDSHCGCSYGQLAITEKFFNRTLNPIYPTESFPENGSDGEKSESETVFPIILNGNRKDK